MRYKIEIEGDSLEQALEKIIKLTGKGEVNSGVKVSVTRRTNRIAFPQQSLPQYTYVDDGIVRKTLAYED